VKENSTNVRTNKSGRTAAQSSLTKLRVLRSVMGLATAVSAPLASKLATEMFIRPRKFKRPSAERSLLWLGEPKSVALAAPAEGCVPTWSWGQGPTIVLVHGWEGRGAQLGAFVSPLVEAGFRVVAFDAPGHGHASGSSSSLPQFADAIEAVALAYGPVYGIVGHSLGCAATMLAETRMAARGEALAERYVFVAPPAKTATYTHLFSQMLGLNAKVRDGVMRELESRFDVQFSTMEPLALAPHSAAKVLVVHDVGDEIIPLEEGRALSAAWKEGQILETTGLGHLRVLKDPAVIRSALHFMKASTKKLVKGAPLAHALDREMYMRYDRSVG
jgi:predicted alpha/beta hydrolase family esterase